MLWVILFELGKILAGFVLFLLGWVVIRHYKALITVKYYQAQGMKAFPGFEAFFVGNAKTLAKYNTLRI